MNTYHTSVLLQETIKQLNLKKGKRYIDGTVGGGGHTEAILERGGVVLGLDVDQEALEFADKELRNKNQELRSNVILVRGNLKDIDIIAKQNGFEKISGILLDIGISGHHVDAQERGFSFQKEGPLDMRMDKQLQVKARDLVNVLTKHELSDLFVKFGEERFARVIAASIVEARKIKQIETTTELSSIIRKAVPHTRQGANPATKVFQALRIAVNDELHSLREALPRAVSLLESGGRLVVISFHSLEDRIVKRTFLEFVGKGLGTIVTKKPIVPSEEEVAVNSRSRSAKLRVFEKI